MGIDSWNNKDNKIHKSEAYWEGTLPCILFSFMVKKIWGLLLNLDLLVRTIYQCTNFTTTFLNLWDLYLCKIAKNLTNKAFLKMVD